MRPMFTMRSRREGAATEDAAAGAGRNLRGRGMDDLRTPCVHRGGPDVVTSPLAVDGQTPADLCICRECRRFWLERNGWLLSRRETLALVRSAQIGFRAEPDASELIRTLAR